MMTLIREGGWPMWFVMLFGALSLIAAAQLTAAADRRQLGSVIGLSIATLFSTLTGIVADLAAVGHHLGQHWSEYFTDNIGYHGAIASQGFAESMSPGFIGFALLSLTWLVVAVGLRRIGRLNPPDRV